MADVELQPQPKKPVNLANLPPDIIRRIVPMSGIRGVERLRLVSPTWNTILKEFLADRRLHPPIECVRIQQWPERDVRISMMVSPHVRPDFHGAFRGWTECSWAIPIDSPILRLRMIRMDDHVLSFYSILIIILLGLLAYFVHPICSVILAILTAAVLTRWRINASPAVTENRACLSRIFARCSSIGQLLLLDLDRRTLSVVLETLEDVPISHLIVVGRTCDEAMRKRIVELTRMHNIEQITISTAVIKKRSFRKFLSHLDATCTVKELEILENVPSTGRAKDRRHWERIARDVRDGPYFVQVMNEERYNLAEGTHLLRLRLTKELIPVVIA